MISGEMSCGARDQSGPQGEKERKKKVGLNEPDSSTMLTSLAEEKPKLFELASESVASSHLW